MMGLYEVHCQACNESFIWSSGGASQTCPTCAMKRATEPSVEESEQWEGPTDAEIYQAVHVYNKEN